MEVGTATTTETINNQIEAFLDSKGRRSKQTRATYLNALVHLSEFISAKYSKYDIDYP
jgi:hypothetical protein